MSSLEVYIGLADDPAFKWEGGDYDGSVPKRITPVFPGVTRSCDDYAPGSPMSWHNTSWHGACKDFGLELIQLDWGASGTRLYKSQILSLLERFAPTASDDLIECVRGLDENTEYALIIMETGTEGFFYSEELGEWLDMEDPDDIEKLKKIE